MSRQPISYPVQQSGQGYNGNGNGIAGPSTGHYPNSRSQYQQQQQTLEPSLLEAGQGSGMESSRRPSGGRSPRTGVSKVVASSLDSHITRLLVHTKQMLVGMEQWAKGDLEETGVSDIYVKLGNEFTTCVDQFKRAGLSTTDLDGIPDELRSCLEQCLAEEASQETLNVYLPSIRNIIFNLLQGLKQRQAAYKRALAERQAQTTPPPPVPAALPEPIPPFVDPPSASRLSARSGRSSISNGDASPASVHSGLPARQPSSHALAERARTASRPAPPDAFRPPRRVPSDTQQSLPIPVPARSVSPQSHQLSTSGSGQSGLSDVQQPQLVRHQLTDNPVPSSSSSSSPFRPTLDTPPAPPPKPIPHPDRFSRDSLGRPISRFSMDSDITNSSPGRTSRTTPADSPAKPLVPLSEDEEEERPSNPPSLPTLNLPSSTFGFDDPPSKPPENIPDVPIETRRTLAALGRSDALERRASKRFSSYTFGKLPGSPNHKKAASTTTESPQRPTRRVDRIPPMPALPESLASSNLGIMASGDRNKTPSPIAALSPPGNDSGELSSSPNSTRTIGSDTSQEGSVRILKTPEPEDITTHSTPRPGASSPPSQRATSLSVFLQIGRQVKKTKLELPVNLSALRLLFMEKFDYDPGVENFPDVYIRDPSTGVQFELEDMDDLRDGSVLNLDIEPLDQVKQHVDMKFAAIMEEMKQELKDMKTSLEHSRRLSAVSHAPTHLAPSPSLTRPLAREASPHTSPSLLPGAASKDETMDPKIEPIDPAMSTPRKLSASEAQARAQLDEIQSLRRDLAIMRQFHVDFLGETKEAFAKLRKENSAMRELVKTKMGGSRAMLDNSKAKLDALCAETIQAVEEVSDVVDAAREDAFKRYVHPSRSQMAKIQADLKRAHDLVASFTNEMSSIEPTWRATWHLELSRVMEEQKLLPHQQSLAKDLKNDIKDAEEMFKNISDFVEQRTTNAAKGVRTAFRPPTPDGNTEGGVKNLLMEIRTKEADPNQRLRAIEAQQRAREKEKANRTDEFQDELAGFVQGRKLKKTGGTDEVDRQRQRKQEQSIRRMLSGSNSVNTDGIGSPTGSGGMLSPQMTGASIKSQSSFTSQTTAVTTPVNPMGSMGRAPSRASARSDDVKQEDIKEEI